LNFFFKRQARPKSGGYYDIETQYLSPLPVPDATNDKKKEVSDLAQKLQELHTSSRDKLLLLERREKKKLEEQLANLKSTELKRLEELNAQALQLEMERDKQRLFREEKRLEALGDIKKAELERLREEQKRLGRFEKIRKAQEAASQKELKAIARERNRIKQAELKNQRYWQEVARKAELSRQNWITIDDSLSLKQGIVEVTDLKEEIANLNQRIDSQFDANQENLRQAYQEQIAATQPLLPPDPAEKDSFETTEEYNQRLTNHQKKVDEAKAEHQQKIDKLKAEKQLKLTQLKVSYLKQKLQVLEPFIQRLQTLQNQKFALPKEKISVTLGNPDADKSRFLLTIQYQGQTWNKYWSYTDRDQARALWKTKSHLIAEGLFQLQEPNTSMILVVSDFFNGIWEGIRGWLFKKHLASTISIAGNCGEIVSQPSTQKPVSLLTTAKISHLGIKEEREFPLETPQSFTELCQWNQIQTVNLPDAESKEKVAIVVYKGVKDPVTGMEFVVVSGGCYQMGSNDGKRDERPVHEVCVNDFLMGKYEVTQGQWRKIMGNNPSYHKRGDDYPVEQVSWNNIQDFIRKLNSRGKGKFRLPTEAEWEYACRAGRQQKYGTRTGRISLDLASYDDSWFVRMRYNIYPVGSFPANHPFRLYDMSGSIWEWVQDRYNESAYGQHQRNNPIYERSGGDRVFRGGSWVNSASRLRCAYRAHSSPSHQEEFIGFRLMRTH